VLTVIAVVIVLMSGGNPWRVLPWAIIPLVILTYLSTSDARRALRR
jgi:hypothetical protein